MNDKITVRGFVATEIRTSTTPGGVATANFRLGSAERHFDRSANTWVEGNINWFTVQGYRQLAGNMGCSIKKGQRVIVVGRLKLRSWEKDGRIYHAVDIDAESVGHDLRWGSANYIRNAGTGPVPGQDMAALDPGDGGPGTTDDAGRELHLEGDGGGVDEYPEFDEETGELKETAA